MCCVTMAWDIPSGAQVGIMSSRLLILIFLKMADEREVAGRQVQVPNKYAWAKLVTLDGDDLELQYCHTLRQKAATNAANPKKSSVGSLSNTTNSSPATKPTSASFGSKTNPWKTPKTFWPPKCWPRKSSNNWKQLSKSLEVWKRFWLQCQKPLRITKSVSVFYTV